ncbi:MAG: hypothetical protein AAF801_06025, partial [Pseudomonadota bacterium]
MNRQITWIGRDGGKFGPRCVTRAPDEMPEFQCSFVKAFGAAIRQIWSAAPIASDGAREDPPLAQQNGEIKPDQCISARDTLG